MELDAGFLVSPIQRLKHALEAASVVENLPPPGASGFPFGLSHILSSTYCQYVKGRSVPLSSYMSKKKRRNSALIICRNEKRFWTTQKQFWTWIKTGHIIKTNDYPLTGEFSRENEELTVLLKRTVLNLACPNHLREVLETRRFQKNK